MQPLLTITDLSHSFGGLRALSDFFMEIFPGELVGLIGPNGAGKTTIFNLITGVFRINQGRILFQGEDISAWASHRITAAGLGAAGAFSTDPLRRHPGPATALRRAAPLRDGPGPDQRPPAAAAGRA